LGAAWHDAQPAAQNTERPLVTSGVIPTSASPARGRGDVTSQKTPRPPNAIRRTQINSRRIVSGLLTKYRQPVNRATANQGMSALFLLTIGLVTGTTSPANLTNNGDDWSTGFGMNFGLAYQANDEWTLGAAYRTKMHMSEFDKYAGLFAGQGDFDIPATASLGAAYTPASNPALTLTAEYQRIFYGDVPAIANSGAVITPTLGADNGPGFGWDDMDVVRIAAQYQANDKLTLRGGISWNSDFIEDNEVLLNTLAPATIRWHASIGASYKMDNGWDFTAAYTHAFNAEKSGANETPGFGQPITLQMDQNEVTFSFSKSW